MTLSSFSTESDLRVYDADGGWCDENWEKAVLNEGFLFQDCMDVRAFFSF